MIEKDEIAAASAKPRNDRNNTPFDRLRANGIGIVAGWSRGDEEES